jgi:uncharacterized protein YecE (DUF72 family)
VYLIYIGTSGYSYKDWKGNFYPEDIKEDSMLEYYSRYFNFTEINFTYYAMPSYKVFEGMNANTPENFFFSVKAFSAFTHARVASSQQAEAFINALNPIRESQKLACILFQFPYSFHKTKENMEYLKKVRDDFKNEHISFEFRNSYWASEDTVKFLKTNDIGWISVDEPNIKGLVRPVAAATSDIGYIRFHGRNKEKWYNHNEAYERYDYLYSEDELLEWMARIKYVEKNSRVTFIAFNNHFRAQGVKNSSMLRSLLNV